MDYEEAKQVLLGWAGRRVTVIAFMDPGMSLPPFIGTLAFEDGDPRALHARIDPAGTRIAFPRATFHEGGWVAGHEDRGLSVVQGSTRVDVFLEDESIQSRRGDSNP